MAAYSNHKPEEMAHRLEKQMYENLKEHWQTYVIEGVIMAAIGVLAAVVPKISSITIDVFLGWVLFVIGLLGIVSRLAQPQAPAFWSNLVLSIATTVLGGLLALWPVQGVITLTMALTAFFIAHGIAMIVMAVSVRHASSGWMWLVVSAIVDFILAALILAEWPDASSWLLGLYVGLNLTFGGLGLVVAALGAHADT